MSFRTFALIAPCVCSLPHAIAETSSPWDLELDLESVTVITPVSESDAPIDVEPILGELSVTGTTETVLENGVRLRARGALRLQADHPARPGGIGGLGDLAIAPVGAFSGLSAASPQSDGTTRTRLETAYFQVDGGYGELRAGKDQGVAARFYEGPKSVFSHARLDSSLLDPTGLSSVRTRHDLTGPSLKVSYASPRLIGLRGGLSYTPEANADGLDRRPAAGTGGLAPDTEHAVELALNGTRRLRDSGWRFDVGLAWSIANVSDQAGLTMYERTETWSAGTRIEKDDWTLGLSWLDSNNGLAESDYQAWSAGLHREAFGTEFSVEYGQSSDDGVDLDSHSLRLGAAREFGKSTKLAIGYLEDRSEKLSQNWKSQGIVVEITLSQ